jgi:hypothetical protein
MRSPRRKSITAIEPGLPLIPLKLARDNRFSHLVEVVEPKRTRAELILSTQNIRSFIGLMEEFRGADLLRRHGLRSRPPESLVTSSAKLAGRNLTICAG